MITATPMNAPSLGQLGNIQDDAEEKYALLRAQCIDNLGPDLCNAVLPRNMIYALTRRDEGHSLPWWVWMLLGLAAGKVIKL